MTTQEQAKAELESLEAQLLAKQRDVNDLRRAFALACQEAHEAGIPDREISEMTHYSRARIQQFRCGQLV